MLDNIWNDCGAPAARMASRRVAFKYESNLSSPPPPPSLSEPLLECEVGRRRRQTPIHQESGPLKPSHYDCAQHMAISENTSCLGCLLSPLRLRLLFWPFTRGGCRRNQCRRATTASATTLPACMGANDDVSNRRCSEVLRPVEIAMTSRAHAASMQSVIHMIRRRRCSYKSEPCEANSGRECWATPNPSQEKFPRACPPLMRKAH